MLPCQAILEVVQEEQRRARSEQYGMAAHDKRRQRQQHSDNSSANAANAKERSEIDERQRELAEQLRRIQGTVAHPRYSGASKVQ